jgi:hypothetical protein
VNNFQFIIEIWIINNSSPIPMQLSGIPKFIASLPVKDKLIVQILYGLGVYSASNENEYQKIFLQLKSSRRIRLAT